MISPFPKQKKKKERFLNELLIFLYLKHKSTKIFLKMHLKKKVINKIYHIIIFLILDGGISIAFKSKDSGEEILHKKRNPENKEFHDDLLYDKYINLK